MGQILTGKWGLRRRMKDVQRELSAVLAWLVTSLMR